MKFMNSNYGNDGHNYANFSEAGRAARKAAKNRRIASETSTLAIRDPGQQGTINARDKGGALAIRQANPQKQKATRKVSKALRYFC